jgi:hypothetical protein
MAYDPYELGSGLPLADTDATVIAMEFRFDTSYSADACVAAITFQAAEGEPQEQLYSLGKGWEPVDRGQGCAHVSGRDLNFNKNSNYGRFLTAAFECEGFLDEVREEGIIPQDPAMFLGKSFFLGTVEYGTRNPSKEGSEETMKTAIVPTAYHGFVGTDEEEEEEPAPKSKAKKSVAKKAAAKPKGAAVKGPSAIEKKQIALIAELEEEDEEMLESLRQLAAESEDHESFMEAAMDLEGVADSEVGQQVAMSSKPGSIWATREA